MKRRRKITVAAGIVLLGVVGFILTLGSVHDHHDFQPGSFQSTEQHLCFLCHVSPNLLVEQDACACSQTQFTGEIDVKPVEVLSCSGIDPVAHPRAPPALPS